MIKIYILTNVCTINDIKINCTYMYNERMYKLSSILRLLFQQMNVKIMRT